jgi:membrane-associated phospholipid phosphatase
MSNLIKKFDVHMVGKGCLRPWNEHFSSVQRARGGFPSGHLATVSYAATLYGVRFGPKWGVPLGLLTAAVGVSFLNCNRHYISQILAGVGLGAIYGVAASKQVDFRLARNYEARLQTKLDVDQRGCPAMKIGVNF